jgi:hypothetical protein
VKPLVRASETNRKFTRSALLNISILGLLALFFSLGFLSREPGVIAFGLVVVAACAAGIVAWVRRLRAATGASPVLEGEADSHGLSLRNRVRQRTWGAKNSPKTTTITRGATVWVTEERPDESIEFLLGVQPHRYWLTTEAGNFAVGSYSRLSRGEFADLDSELSANGSTVHWLLERTPEQGPHVLPPVRSGSPASITLALPEGAAVVGAYSDRGEAGWVAREHAYAHAFPLPIGSHYPVTLSFSVDRIDPDGWAALPTLRLAAYADTFVLATRGGVPQLVVRCPAGFSIAYFLRGVGAHSNRIHVHLDGAPPSA